MRPIPFAATLTVGTILLGMAVQAAGPDKANRGQSQARPSASSKSRATTNPGRTKSQAARSTAPSQRPTSSASASSQGRPATNPGRTRSTEVRRTLPGLKKQVQPQAGTGRLGQQTLPTRSAGHLKHPQGNAFGRNRKLQSTAERPTRPEAAGVEQAAGTAAARQLTPGQKAERLLQLRLSKIDHLRDVGLQNGNEQLLQKADELEQLARQQYERRMADIKTMEPPAGDEANSPADSATQVDAAPRIDRRKMRGFGPLTAEEARRLRREFGKQTADGVRNAAATSADVTTPQPPTAPESESELPE